MISQLLFCICISSFSLLYGDQKKMVAVPAKPLVQKNNGAQATKPSFELSCNLLEDGFTPIKISADQIKKIGEKIWYNECRQTIKGLTSWNNGEDFASFGIGHFISYPKGKSGIFKETFPTLLTFLLKHKKMPAGILKTGVTACPWENRQEFLGQLNSKQMVALRTYLADTVDLQALFMVQRLMQSFPITIKKLSSDKKEHIKKQFIRMINTQGGLYALIDYVNFKGEGLKGHEEYHGYRWGLLQVLENMEGATQGKVALEEFARAAKKVLTGRVSNAPLELREKESRWLVGWLNRIKTYTHL